MPQWNDHLSNAAIARLVTVDGLLPVRGMLLVALLALLLLLSHGGAG